MADPPALDPGTTSLIRFALAIATGHDLAGRAADLVAAGVPERQVEELLLQSVLMAGWPRALVAAGVWRSAAGGPAPAEDAQASHANHEVWTARGEATCRAVYGDNYQRLRANVRELHPALDAWMVTEGYGRTLSREGLDLVIRELCVVAQTAALNTPHQLHSHLRGTLNVGGTPAQIEAVLALVTEAVPVAERETIADLWNRVRERWVQDAD